MLKVYNKPVKLHSQSFVKLTTYQMLEIGSSLRSMLARISFIVSTPSRMEGSLSPLFPAAAMQIIPAFEKHPVKHQMRSIAGIGVKDTGRRLSRQSTLWLSE
jgi:hypothetical protein